MRSVTLQRTIMALVMAGFVLSLTASAWAQGLIVDRRQTEWPEDTPIPPARNFGISIKSHAIEVSITNQVATTKITQVFHNPHRANLEGTYFFPLPEHASISQFSMTMEGVMVEGEVLPADEARRIYEGIVATQRDPGLLEYIGRKLFRARIFPVTPQGDTTVVMTYSELLNGEAGLVRYTYPLNTTKYTDLKTDEVVVKVAVQSDVPVRAMYSPSHDVEVIRDGENKATVGYEAKNIAPNRDFMVYYTVNTDDVGLTLMSYKDAGEDGYFMLIATPKQEYTAEEIQPKDIVFVVDVSGSMTDGNKIAQARNALKYCLQSLNPNDRFNIVPFSTVARKYRDALVPATPEMIESAVRYTDSLRASGGTAIDEALTLGLGMFAASGETRNVPMMVFMTDGQPTIGERNVANILRNAERNSPQNIRIFTFGVGHDVNTHLLDKLAESTRAAVEYIAPEEDIEAKVGPFFDKLTSPVLANLTLNFGDVETYDVFPRELPDLFKGTQLVIFGRYRGEGPQAVRLNGVVNGQAREFVYEGNFAAADVRSEFLPRLWAVRKVGFMMDEIRLRGFNDELKNEIVRLGTRFGIVTPYTSFLVVTDEEMERFNNSQRPRPIRPGRGPADPSARRGGEDAEGLRDRQGWGGGSAPAENPDSALAAPPAASNRADADGDLSRESNDGRLQAGQRAIERSQQLRALKAAETLDDAAGTVGGQMLSRTVGSKTFTQRQGWWIDNAFDPEQHKADARISVDAFSPAYFELLRQFSEFARYAALGERVVIVHDGKAYVIAPPAEADNNSGN